MILEKQYLIPDKIEEAIIMASSAIGRFRYLAGATDVMANKFRELDEPECLIDISRIPALKNISTHNKQLVIGSLTTLEQIINHPTIRNNFPALAEAAHAVGSPLIRKVATLGGNILCENRCIFYNQDQWWRESVGFCLKNNGDTCIATGGTKHCYSEIVSDTAPALISMDAQIKLVDMEGTKTIKLEDIYTGDGIHPRNISDTAIVKEILLPLNRDFRTVFKKLRLRKSLDFTSLSTSVSIDNEDKLKIAAGGVDPKVVVVSGSASDDKALLVRRTLKGARAINNEMFSREYRRKMLAHFLYTSFEELNI